MKNTVLEMKTCVFHTLISLNTAILNLNGVFFSKNFSFFVFFRFYVDKTRVFLVKKLK